jgi:hypothetical protein
MFLVLAPPVLACQHQHHQINGDVDEQAALSTKGEKQGKPRVEAD